MAAQEERRAMKPGRAQRRVLVVVTFDPWPVRSGITRRLDALIRALDAACELHVLVCDVVGASGADPVDGAVTRVPRDPSRLQSLVQVLRGAPTLRPVTAAFYVRPSLRRAVRTHVRKVQPDLVVTHGIGGAELVRGIVPSSQVVLDADTIDPETYRRVARDVSGRGSLQWALDARLLGRWHRRNLPHYRAVTVVSQDDVQRYEALAPRARLALVPNGVELPALWGSGRADGPALFVGDLQYPPNRSAVAWLAEALLPAAPDLRVRVVGAGAVPEHERMDAPGFVDDIEPEWRGSSALVVPLWSGGGTRLKVLEAMSHGLPVVSTCLGVEGLHAVPGRDFLEAKTADEFALQLRLLRDDEALRSQLSGAGRALAERFAWATCSRALVELVTST